MSVRASSSIKRPDDEIERVAQCAAAGRRKRRPWILTKLYRPETTYSWDCSYGNACLRRAGRPGTGSRALPLCLCERFSRPQRQKHARSARRPAHSRVGEWTLIKGPKMKRPNVTSDQQLKRAGSRLT